MTDGSSIPAPRSASSGAPRSSPAWRNARPFLCGVAMGAADIVPGVSGGTVALILGIYERLVRAISRFDLELVYFLAHRRFAEAARHVDLRFLVTLGAGIGTGILLLASLMNHLLTSASTRPYTLGAFFGLILASSVLVARMTGARDAREASRLLLPWALAVLFAFWLTGLPGRAAGDPSLAFAFGSGAVAICAMILPGISGAFLLLLLGMYVYVTGILRRLPGLDATAHEMLVLGVFACGCAVGLLLFSRVLRFLLARYLAPTLAVLCGFMLGSLRRIWPFQRDVTLEHLDRAGLDPQEVARLREHPDHLAELDAKHRIFENVAPATIDLETLSVLAVVLSATIFVFAVDTTVRRAHARGS